MKRVAVAILNWNGEELLHRYLPSVVEHSSMADLILVDNHSSDGSLDFVRKTYPQIEIIETGKNLGYAGGYNFALERIENEIIVLLNSDIEVTEGWLEPQVKLFDSYENVGACQPKILAVKDPESFEYAGAGGGYIDLFGYPFCRGRLFENLEEDLGQFNDCREVFWASGACMMVSRKAFYEALRLDELFFAHMEEIDLCWRMKNKGYRVMYCGESTVFHLGGGTLDSQNPKKTYLNFRNNLFLLFKNLPSNVLFGVLIIRMILDGLAGIKFIFDFKFRHVIAIVSAHLSFYKYFPRIARQRMELSQTSSRSRRLIGIYQRPVVFDFYLFGKKRFENLPGKIH